MFAKVLGFAFSVPLPLVVVRCLAQNDVGVYRQVFQIITNASVILPLGLSMSAYYFLPREPTRRGAAILNILIFNFTVGGLACLALFVEPRIIGAAFRSAEITRLAPWIGLVTWLWIFASFLEVVAVANQEARLAAVFIVLVQGTKALSMVSAAALFSTVDSFLYAATLQGALQIAVLILYLVRRFPGFWATFDATFFREQVTYALPFGFAGLLWTLQTDIHNYFVGYRFTAAEYAIYAYGCFQLPLMGMLQESITGVLIPRMSSLAAQHDRAEMIRLTLSAMEKLALVYFPVYVFMLITAEAFVTTLFTKAYVESVPVFVINLTLLPLSALVTDPVVRAYRELGQFLLALRTGVTALLVAALFYGMQKFNLPGMIAIVVAAALVEKTITTLVVLRRLGVGPSDLRRLSRVGRTAACATAAGVVTYLWYRAAGERTVEFVDGFAALVLGGARAGLSEFLSGACLLASCAFVFVPLYLGCALATGVIKRR